MREDAFLPETAEPSCPMSANIATPFRVVHVEKARKAMLCRDDRLVLFLLLLYGARGSTVCTSVVPVCIKAFTCGSMMMMMTMMMHALDERGINVALKLFQMTDLSLY